MIGHVPAVDVRVAFRQQLALDPRGQVEILLERPLFARRQMVQAEAGQGIRQQPIRLDWIVARVAQAERARLHPPQCGVNFLQQTHDVVGPVARGGRGFQLLTTVEELLAEYRKRRSFHV